MNIQSKVSSRRKYKKRPFFHEYITKEEDLTSNMLEDSDIKNFSYTNTRENIVDFPDEDEQWIESLGRVDID